MLRVVASVLHTKIVSTRMLATYTFPFLIDLLKIPGLVESNSASWQDVRSMELHPKLPHTEIAHCSYNSSSYMRVARVDNIGHMESCGQTLRENGTKSRRVLGSQKNSYKSIYASHTCPMNFRCKSDQNYVFNVP